MGSWYHTHAQAKSEMWVLSQSYGALLPTNRLRADRAGGQRNDRAVRAAFARYGVCHRESAGTRSSSSGAHHCIALRLQVDGGSRGYDALGSTE